MSPFEHPEFDNHENIIFCRDPDLDLFAIIAIHDTTLGPAAGGCRMYPYGSFDDALTDVLRLSRGMTYKNAAAGLDLGGGKCVVMADPKSSDKARILRGFARFIERLGGAYWTAIDVGISPKDVDVLRTVTRFAFMGESQFPEGFNPAEFTSLGGFLGIKAVMQHLTGSDDLNGATVALQGVGGTGAIMCRLLNEAGAKLIISDVDAERIDFAVQTYGAVAVAPDAIYDQEVDVFAPCALGAILNDDTIPRLKCKAVSGLANNQLAEDRHEAALMERGILYVPDFVVNAGGIIGGSQVMFEPPAVERSNARIAKLYDTVLEILNRSHDEGKRTQDIADAMAKERLNA
ncbi:MAG: amino acid dehydrogenase [Pseudomonadota bacterium]